MNFTKTNSMLVSIAIIASISIIGCNSPSQKVENADANVIQAENDLAQAQDEYADEVANFKIETDEKITINEKTISDIKERMQIEKASNTAEYKTLISELEQKNSDMKKRMVDYKEDGNDKWQSFKSEFNHDMDELGNSLNDFFVNNKK